VSGSGSAAGPATEKCVELLADRREAARRARNWTEADRIRAEIDGMGYLIEDTPRGPRILKK
jgi:cysteinyl-tRNA synthetase